MDAVVLDASRRESLAKYGRLLGILTICWGLTEASLALWSAAETGSVSLASFGGDSIIEVLSALAVSWRMSHEMNHERRHHAERTSLRITGYCLLGLATYVFIDAGLHLVRQDHATVGKVGIAVTAAALVCMPLLAREKRRVGQALASGAMMTDAKQTDFCTYQAAIVLLGLSCHSLFGITWADGVAALILVPILVRAGVLALRGEHCCVHH